ncbi:hypothetical protein JKP88DRAFT_247539 [Tribonema minus]|uniref:Uncharacterized protein n=1 Tax=Tribonema minus TaxID=303371 RepID=A0A835YQG4_9STRA|nr:hypothetical protein JKP88DRAFT_247539 [Tribonema minus]
MRAASVLQTASAPRSAPAAPVAASSSTRTVTGDACTPPRAGLCIQHAAMQRGDPLDMLEPDARAQLDGAARQARHPATCMLMQQSPTQIRLAEQRQSEALTEAARRQRAHQRQEELSQLLQQDQLNAQAVLQQRKINAQQRALDAQQAALLAEQACLRAEWRALEHASVRSRAGRDANSANAPSQGGARYGGGSSGGGGDSGGSGSSGGGGDSGGSNSSDGGGGSGGGSSGSSGGGGDSGGSNSSDGGGGSDGGSSGGGDGDGGGGSTSGATVSHYGDDNSARRASVTAAAPLAAAEVDLAGFDASGYAIMRFAVTLDEKQFPKTKVDQGNVSALTSLQKQLPGKFRSAALALRQKQQPLWPALRKADDFGCEWFNTTVYSIVSCIANGGGDHLRLGMLARQASSWETQGGEQGLRDGALLSWLFTKIGKFLEIAEPTSVAANLMNWSLRQGLALKLFIIEFSDAAHTATLLDNSLDHIVVTALLRIVRHHYPNISGAYKHAICEPTIQDCPIFPTDLTSYGQGLGGSSDGGSGDDYHSGSDAEGDEIHYLGYSNYDSEAPGSPVSTAGSGTTGGGSVPPGSPAPISAHGAPAVAAAAQQQQQQQPLVVAAAVSQQRQRLHEIPAAAAPASATPISAAQQSAATAAMPAGTAPVVANAAAAAAPLSAAHAPAPAPRSTATAAAPAVSSSSRAARLAHSDSLMKRQKTDHDVAQLEPDWQAVQRKVFQVPGLFGVVSSAVSCTRVRGVCGDADCVNCLPRSFAAFTDK